MSFTMTNLSDNLNGITKAEADKLGTLAANKDGLSDTEHMLKMQQAMQKWSMAVNLQSNMMKSYGDAVKSVISNMR